MSREHLFLITYDISDPKRLRRVFRLLEGYGQWVQLSVFQCRLTELRRRRLINELEGEIKRHEDHVLLFKLGSVKEQPVDFVSLGKVFEPIRREPIII
ncbi:CRISPR-associated endonuclease Cas2 [Oceanimonas smirnovii]|uniref:CRISPR-associated endonuclease Cas2 n=1 Tax=Oceanimonas smirnovii TaxID=264574 RepID=UPI003AAC76AA